jgi:hypothetical protein
MASRPSVLVRRVGAGWRAEAGAPGQWVQARNLSGLFNQLRLLVDLNASRVVFDTGDAELDALLAEIRTAWRRADAARRTAQALADRLLSRADGLSNRDIAVLIGKSHQRVAQLRQQHHTTDENEVPHRQPGGATPRRRTNQPNRPSARRLRPIEDQDQDPAAHVGVGRRPRSPAAR